MLMAAAKSDSMPDTQLKTLWISFLIIGLDQATKLIAVSLLPFRQTVSVIPYFDWYLTHNPGAAFSFLAEAGGWQRWFFTITSIVISAIIFVWLRKLESDDRFTAIALCLILGGAIGNLIDRIYLGYVIDYIQVWLGSYPWPAFNIADAAISVGAAFLLLSSFVSPQSKASRDS
ncbi:MAG: lipoprotein signal peptidase [Gammaproteobacteria bacterium]|nr:lipoprotein signal peptidase [Gammaproteobacteria bacterium]